MLPLAETPGPVALVSFASYDFRIPASGLSATGARSLTGSSSDLPEKEA
mgnify:CR=1 FL=1